MKRRPIRGYIIDSDDDCYPEEGHHLTESKPIFDDGDSLTCVDDTPMDADYNDTRTVLISHQQPSIGVWLTFSLPRYTMKVEIPPPLTVLEKTLASVTMYSELKEANMDSHFERVFVRLQQEWTYIGGLVCRSRFIGTFSDHGPLSIVARRFSCVSTLYLNRSAFNLLIHLLFCIVLTQLSFQ